MALAQCECRLCYQRDEGRGKEGLSKFISAVHASSICCPHQERHHTKVQYQLKSEQISLAQVFSKMEQVVDVLGIEDYSVSQTTLDNVSVGESSYTRNELSEARGLGCSLVVELQALIPNKELGRNSLPKILALN